MAVDELNYMTWKTIATVPACLPAAPFVRVAPRGHFPMVASFPAGVSIPTGCKPSVEQTTWCAAR